MEAIKANEINEIIRAQIEHFDSSMTVDEVGTVIKVGDGIAEIHGLEKVMAGELLEFPHGVRGLVAGPVQRPRSTRQVEDDGCTVHDLAQAGRGRDVGDAEAGGR